jgi:putative addiction module component (TIGR02574 family)
LSNELWEALENDTNADLLTPEQIAELDQAVEEYQRDPTQVTTWEEIQKRILGRTLDSRD